MTHCCVGRLEGREKNTSDTKICLSVLFMFCFVFVMSAALLLGPGPGIGPRNVGFLRKAKKAQLGLRVCHVASGVWRQ